MTASFAAPQHLQTPSPLRLSIRAAVILAVVMTHGLFAAWLWLQKAAVLPAAAYPVVSVDWIAPPKAAPQPPQPKAPPARPQPTRVIATPAQPKSLAADKPAPAETVTQPEPETPAAQTVPDAPSPPASTPAPAAAPVPPPAPAPREIPASAVRYRLPPQPQMPRASQRLNEQGRVVVRVLIDTQGRPAQMTVEQSSGFDRLDREALRAISQSQFFPYQENGRALAAWVRIPIVFKLD